MGEPAKQPDDAPKVEDGGQVILFSGKFEGQRVVDYRLNFGGNIEIGDAELVKALSLNGSARLVVEGYVASRGHKMKSGKDGSRNGAVSSSVFIVESVALEQPDE